MSGEIAPCMAITGAASVNTTICMRGRTPSPIDSISPWFVEPHGRSEGHTHCSLPFRRVRPWCHCQSMYRLSITQHVDLHRPAETLLRTSSEILHTRNWLAVDGRARDRLLAIRPARPEYR